MKPTLSILIATVNERLFQFEALQNEFLRQIAVTGMKGKIEIVPKCDNKEMSIGNKRQWLLENCSGEWVVFFDDDDWPYPHYIPMIYNSIATEGDHDCIGLIINMTTNGRRPQTCCHSFRFKKWETNQAGYDYVRNITHFNPVKRNLALKTGFKDLRFGEDQDYSDRLTPICTKEIFIPVPVFNYRYTSYQSHNQKYGIT